MTLSWTRTVARSVSKPISRIHPGPSTMLMSPSGAVSESTEPERRAVPESRVSGSMPPRGAEIEIRELEAQRIGAPAGRQHRHVAFGLHVTEPALHIGADEHVVERSLEMHRSAQVAGRREGGKGPPHAFEIERQEIEIGIERHDAVARVDADPSIHGAGRTVLVVLDQVSVEGDVLPGTVEGA